MRSVPHRSDPTHISAHPTVHRAPNILSSQDLDWRSGLGNQAVQRTLRSDILSHQTPPHTYATSRGTLQAHFVVGSATNAHEREAERVAEEIVAAPEASTHATGDCGGKSFFCDRHNQSQRQVQPTRVAGHPPAEMIAPPVVDEVLASNGRALDSKTLDYMQSRFGHDFSQVRVHTDEHASRSAAAIEARAYAVGHNLVFASGAYQPATTAGRRLIAHELTHSIQQSRTGTRSASSSISPAPAQVARSPGTASEAAEADTADLEAILLDFMNMLSPKVRATVVNYKTVAIGIARQGKFRTLVYSTSRNWTNPEVRAAADALGMTRSDSTNSISDIKASRVATGGATDAEQILEADTTDMGMVLEMMAVTREVCPWCRVAVRHYSLGKIKVVQISIPTEPLAAEPAGGAADFSQEFEVFPEAAAAPARSGLTPEGAAPAAAEGSSIAGAIGRTTFAIAPIIFGFIHQRAEGPRMKEIADQKGYAAPNDYSGPWYNRFLDKVGDALYDPTLEGKDRVPLEDRFNVKVWRKKIRAYFGGHAVGDRVTFTWGGDTEIEYTLMPSGRWVANKERADIMDINWALSATTSDQAILDWLQNIV